MNTQEDTKKSIQPIDVIHSWVDSENNEYLHSAKTNFLRLVKKNMRDERYTIVHRGYNLTGYVSSKSRSYFREVVVHNDFKNGKIATMYEWKFENNSVYILAIDDVDSETNTWLQRRLDFYNDVATRGQTKEGGFDEKSYSILRHNCFKDFGSKFISTFFFEDFELAKRTLTMKVEGHVKFLKKERYESDDESVEGR